jgi:hypothetical protein
MQCARSLQLLRPISHLSRESALGWLNTGFQNRRPATTSRECFGGSPLPPSRRRSVVSNHWPVTTQLPGGINERSMSAIAVVRQTTSQPPNCRPPLDRRLGLTQDSFQELLGASGASHADDYWPHTRLGDELECQEGATLPFCHNHFRYNRNPLAIAGNAESIPISESSVSITADLNWASSVA